MDIRHIDDYKDTMYRLTDLYNHKGFIHWNSKKRYTGESSFHRNMDCSYKVYDLIDKNGYIYYEVYRAGVDTDNFGRNIGLNEEKDLLVLTTYNNRYAQNYADIYEHNYKQK